MKILSELSNDASISVPKLAEKINTNSSVVYSRIKRLQKQKLIKKFTIDVNDKELGYGVKSVTGINMDSKERDNIIEKLFPKCLVSVDKVYSGSLPIISWFSVFPSAS